MYVSICIECVHIHICTYIPYICGLSWALVKDSYGPTVWLSACLKAESRRFVDQDAGEFRQGPT